MVYDIVWLIRLESIAVAIETKSTVQQIDILKNN